MFGKREVWSKLIWQMVKEASLWWPLQNQHVLKKSRMIDEGKVSINVFSLEDSWRLFCVHVFPRGSLNIPLYELQQVARLVVDECKGLALALKVIGGSCMLPQHKLLKEENKLFGWFKLNYDNLDNDAPQSKCFLDFVKFPKDFLVPIKDLPRGKYYKSI